MLHKNKKDIGNLILKIVAAAGAVALAAVAPNAVQILKSATRQEKSKRIYYVNKKVQELIDRKLLSIESTDGKFYIELTKAGELRLNKFRLKESNKNPKKWDGKWRIIIFDVWERARNKRDHFRMEIKEFGFKQVQQSVWAYPYECNEFIELIKSEMHLGQNVKYLLVEKIDNDFKLRQQFKLN
jgi:DNA-binding transcriptional regulator PaaX